MRILAKDWLPEARVVRVIGHWTAGGYVPTEFDRQHYHFLVKESGVVRGIPSVQANSLPRVRPGYAAHTRACNSGSIGVAIAAMAGAQERPLRVGKAPITENQWKLFVHACADLCEVYRIAPGPRTLLTHAEVQANLGIAQRGKWDIAILPFDPAYNTAKLVGDRLRAEVKALL